MALTDRVRKLERRSGMESLCAVCHGHGWQRSSLVMNGVELEPVRPVGCPGCGRGEINHVMVVDVPGDEWANERFVITRIFGCKDPDEADTAAGMARWTARGNAAGGQPHLSPDPQAEPTPRCPATNRVEWLPFVVGVLLGLAFLSPILVPGRVAVFRFNR